MNARSEASKGTTLPPAPAALAAKLRAATQAGLGFYDPAVRKLRSELAQALRIVLLEDYATAQEHNVEQTLWKVVYYRPIEEFRRRIRLASEAGNRGQEPLRKAQSAFNQLLSAASTFYRSLALDVQAVYGHGGCPVSFPEQPAIGTSAAPPIPNPSPVDVRPTISRCLICLGDLARYQINASQEAAARDWAPAARHYLQAARVLPTTGNAYNQLAVLDTYVGDELAAVGHYFCALAVAQPFLVARDNLLLLFEQNRIRYDALRSSSRGWAATAGQNKNQRGGRSIKQRPSQHPATMADLVTHFVRLHGVLFTRINVDTFPAVAAVAATELQHALQVPGILRSLTSAPGGSIADSPAVRLAVMAAFSVSNVDYSADGRPPGVAETMQRRELRAFAVAALLQLAAAFCGAAADAKAAPPSSGGAAAKGGRQPNGAGADLRLRLLPAVHVLLLWAAGHPDVAGPRASGGPELGLFREALQRLQAWAQAQPAPQPVNAVAAQRLRLPELVSLRGFLPLALAGLTADTPPPNALDFKEEQPVRLASIQDALQQLCSAEGQLGQVAAAAAAGSWLPAAVEAAPAPAQLPPPALQLDADDDEDEEVIVYAPGAGSPAEPPEPATLWQRPAAPAASAWTPPSPAPTQVASPSPSVDAVPESAPRAGVPGGWGTGVLSSVPPQAAPAAPSLDGSAQMAAGGGGGLFDGGVAGSFLGRDIFAQHRVGGGGSIGFGLADMGAPTTGGSSGAMSGEMRAGSPFAATDDWGRQAPAPVASLWSGAVPQTKSQQDQWQQSQQQPPPEPAGYQPFGPTPWTVPPTPDGQPSPWQPQRSHPTHGPDQLGVQRMPWQQQEQQQQPQPLRQPGGQSSGSVIGAAQPLSTEVLQHTSAEHKAAAPPLVQDWSWLSSLPSK